AKSIPLVERLYAFFIFLMAIFSNDWKDHLALSNRMRKGLLFLFVILSAEIIALLYLHFVPAKTSELKIENLQPAVDKLIKKDSIVSDEQDPSALSRNSEDNEEAE